jgi:hypothetical protein
MKVAAVAEAFNLPVVSHVMPEIHAHLVAACPNGLTVEYMPWVLRLFEETPRLEKGALGGGSLCWTVSHACCGSSNRRAAAAFPSLPVSPVPRRGKAI